MDASNLLKPAFARGELHCVGATTLDEYRKHVEKDAALARRFQPVSSPSLRSRTPSRSCAGSRRNTSCTMGCASRMRPSSPPRHCRNRYITDRFLPDKAIDLVDEAAARLRMQVDSKPEELDSVDREIVRLKIEQEALKKESDPGSKDRSLRIDKELADLEERSAALDRQMAGRERKLNRAQKLKEEIDKASEASSTGTAQAANLSAPESELWHHPRAREGTRRDRSQGRRRRQAAPHGRGSDARTYRGHRRRAGRACPSKRCSRASARSS